MNDLISRIALFNIVEPRLDYLRDKNGPYDHYTDGYEECYDRIVEAPPVDAVEVVRCKDCKHFKIMSDGYTKCAHRYGLAMVLLDNFCSYGERKSE